MPLATGELVRVTVAVLGIEADEPEEFGDPLGPLLPLPAAVDAQRFGHDVTDRHPRVERRERILEDDLHLTSQRPQHAP